MIQALEKSNCSKTESINEIGCLHHYFWAMPLNLPEIQKKEIYDENVDMNLCGVVLST